jgi:ubiquinone/menaquinone biosynthesis C-methylase UbiE
MNVKGSAYDKFSLSRPKAWRWVQMYEEPRDLFEVTMLARRNYVVDYVMTSHRDARHVLDLGCGAGPLSSALIANGIDVVGMDLSADLLRQAAERIASKAQATPRLLQANCEVLPFRDGQFDLVAALGVIAFLEDEGVALREMTRVLRPGGTLVLSFRSLHALSLVLDPISALKRLVKRLLALVGITRRSGETRGQTRRFAPRNVIAQLTRLGFTLEEVKHLGYGPLKLNNRELLSARGSIAFSHWLSRFFELPLLKRFQHSSDVWILVLRRA